MNTTEYECLIHTRQGSDVGFLMYHDPCNMKKNARYAVAFCAVFIIASLNTDLISTLFSSNFYRKSTTIVVMIRFMSAAA